MDRNPSIRLFLKHEIQKGFFVGLESNPHVEYQNAPGPFKA